MNCATKRTRLQGSSNDIKFERLSRTHPTDVHIITHFGPLYVFLTIIYRKRDSRNHLLGVVDGRVAAHALHFLELLHLRRSFDVLEVSIGFLFAFARGVWGGGGGETLQSSTKRC